MDKTQRFQAIGTPNISRTRAWRMLITPNLREEILTVGAVLPFRTNQYVVDQLIDWTNIPNDPMFQLTFPQMGMLTEEDYEAVRKARKSGNKEKLAQIVTKIRWSLNPHPAGQMTHNVPELDGRKLEGLQHKYNETVLFFPAKGQTCHAYCTYCFRWAQFVGMDEIKFESQEVNNLAEYLKRHKEVTDVLFTGGDPMIMTTENLRQYIEPLLVPELEHIQDIRIGTKAVAYWPQRFVTDPDADDCLQLFEQIVKAGKHVAIMGHYSHPIELESDIAQKAIKRILSTGAQIRMQAPLIKHVNNNPAAWAEMWTTGVKLGMIPYYMFVERDTGARNYFEVPLAQCYEVFSKALRQVSGLARTVRGPSMSCFPGKVRVLGIENYGKEKVFELTMIQSRNPEWVNVPFRAKFDPKATWFDQLKPADCEQEHREFFINESDAESIELTRTNDKTD